MYFQVAFLVNYIFAEVEGGWRVSFGLSGGIALAQAAAVVILLPRTPQFLIIRYSSIKQSCHNM